MLDFLIEKTNSVAAARKSPALGLRITSDSTIEATNPPWLRTIEKKVNILLNLSENWDGYGAQRIIHECVIAAFSLVLPPNATHETPEPQFVPTSQGGIQVEWHLGGIDLELVFDPSASAHYYYAELNGIEIEGEVGDDPSLVRSLIRALPTRNDFFKPAR